MCYPHGVWQPEPQQLCPRAPCRDGLLRTPAPLAAHLDPARVLLPVRHPLRARGRRQHDGQAVARHAQRRSQRHEVGALGGVQVAPGARVGCPERDWYWFRVRVAVVQQCIEHYE